MRDDYASCCVLSYNRPDFLATCIESLRERTEHPLELIVHDDGSTDVRCQALLSEYLQEGIISTLVLNPPGHNQGVGTAVNRMFQLASGDPIIKIDQDLIFQPHWLEKMVQIFDLNAKEARILEEPPIGAMGAFRYPVDPVDAAKMFVKDHGTWEEHEDFVGSLIAVPRSIWERKGPFQEHSDAFAEDIVFKTMLKRNGYAMALPPEDIAVNQGFGVGPSTVVVDHGTVARINHEPLVH